LEEISNEHFEQLQQMKQGLQCMTQGMGCIHQCSQRIARKIRCVRRRPERRPYWRKSACNDPLEQLHYLASAPRHHQQQHTHMQSHTHALTHTCTHTFSHTHTHTCTHTCTHTHIHTDALTHTHTLTHTQQQQLPTLCS
jgi:hypothetical protein